MTLNKSMRWALCALVGLALAACGGGGTSVASTGGGVGTGGTGISMGTVTGFGSVVVDGTAYSSATPVYYEGTELAESALASSAAVELGDQLQIQLDAQGNPATVVIEPELRGAVSNLSALPSGGFAVNGVAVRVNTDPMAGPVTYYAGLVGYGGLAAGMPVEVHGAYGIDTTGQGYIQATLIEQSPSTTMVSRITGVVSSLTVNGTSSTFKIGATTVQFGSSSGVLPTTMSLANGQLVNVWSNVAPVNGVLSAGVIRIRTLQGVSGPVQISGLVAGLTGTGFQLSGIAVDASDAGLATVLQSLQSGQYVVVQGTATAATGVVIASKIQVYASQLPAPVALHGTITGYVSASNFLVRGVSVDASKAAFLTAGTSSADLSNGVFVDVVGRINGNAITAASVAVQRALPAGKTVDYQGVVSQCPAAPAGCGSFVLTLQDGTPRNVTLASNVAYSNGIPAQLINGASVEVEATTTTTTADLVAYSVSFQRLSPPVGGGGTAPPLETHGLAYDLTSTQFLVNGLTIQINGVTPTGGTLANGTKVEVNFLQSSGQNLATAISIDQ